MKTKLLVIILLLLVSISSTCSFAQMRMTSFDHKDVIHLFNNKDLSDWEFVLQDNTSKPEDIFTVKDSILHIESNTLGYMYTKEKYDNYRLYIEWRWIKPSSDNGIFVLINESNKPYPSAIECRLKENNSGDFIIYGNASLAEYTTHENETRPLFPTIAKKYESNENPVGEWNQLDIFIIEGIVSVYINGKFQNEGTSLIKSGHVGIKCVGGEPIEFKKFFLIKINP